MADEEPFQHNAVGVAAIVGAFLFAAIQLIMGFFSYAGFGFFQSTLEELNSAYETEAYPSYSLPIVGLIVFAIQIPWTIYSITTIWRVGANDYLYVDPGALSIITSLSFICNCVLNIVWFFLWDRGELIAQVAILFAGAGVAVLTLGSAVYVLWLNVGKLEKLDKKSDIFFNRFLVHNGLSALTAWLFYSTAQQASVVAVYAGSMTDYDASTMSIGLLAFASLLTIGVHDFLLPYFHYCFFNYFVWVAILIPIIIDFDGNNRNHILTLVLLITIGLFLVIKIVRFCIVPAKTYEGDESDDDEVTERAVAILGDVKPQIMDVKPKMTKSTKTKKTKKVGIDQDIDGEINLVSQGRINPSTVGRYHIMQTPAQTEMYTSQPTVAYQQVEVLNVPRTRTVPAFDPYHDPIVPQEAQLYYNPGSSHHHHHHLQHAQPPPQPIYNSGPVTIEPVTNPNMLSMHSLKNLSGTPMGIMTLPKTAIPQPQPAPTCASMYGTCGNVQMNQTCGGNVHLNQMPAPSCQCQRRY